MLKTLGIILVFLAAVQARQQLVLPLNFSTFDFSKLSLDSIKFSENSDLSEECLRDLSAWREALEKGEPDALFMVDSIPKSIDGLLLGHFHTPGHFDECVRARVRDFQGQHCMIPFEISALSTLADSSGNNEVDPLGFFFSFGICLPSTCNISDINNILSGANETGIIRIGSLTEKNCSIDEYPPLRSEDWVTILVLLFIVLIAVCSTYYEVFQKFVRKNDKPNELLTSFSLYKNTQFLFTISQNSAQLKCLNGIRFFSMTWVILGHAYITYLWGAPMNTSEGFKFAEEKSVTPVNNAFVSVDSFFFLSGLLVCLVFFRDISKKGSFDVPVAFIHRYLRLTPPFAILMLVQATIISRIGNGPFWKNNIERVENSCRNSWWSGLLYIQNYVMNNNMCLGQSWYLSADMQMFWLSPLILYPMLLFPAMAPYFLIVLILAASLTNFSIAYVNDLFPRMNFFDISNNEQFMLEYSPFHTRMAPWLIGVFTGYIICGIQAKKIRFQLSWIWTICGWIIGLGLLGGSLFGIIRFVDAEYSTLEGALYLSFHRVGWALGLSWVVLACVTGHGGPVNFFLSLDIFQPLGKLSYCNFLIHMTLQFMRLFTSRINQYIGHFEIIYAYFGDLFLSFLIAIPLCLLFELPFTSIDRHFFQKLTIFPYPPPKEKKEKVDEEKEKPEKIPMEEKMDKMPLEDKMDKMPLEDKMEKGIDNPTFKES